MKSVLVMCGLLASSVVGHIQMSKPYPIRSPLNPDGDESKKDYSYTNPLSTSGSDYPCKGYAGDAFKSVATYSPGGEYDLELQGSATHEGGSCQVSLSYDSGKNFQVIHSMIGGCPLTESYKFSIPSDAPGGDALLAWTWFNKVGNREMYMNCAQVTIGGSASRKETTREVNEKRNALSYKSAPPVFIANVNGPGQCTTIEGDEVNFPLPGDSVEGSGSGQGYTCTGSAAFLGSGSSSHSTSTSNSGSTSSGTGASGSSSSSSSNNNSVVGGTSAHSSSQASTPAPSSSKMASQSATPASSSAAASSKVASSFGSSSAKTVPLPTSASDGSSDRFVPGGPCVDGAIICGPGGKTWSLCSNGRPVHMGAVAAGTYCDHGVIGGLY
ncbi:hypothetical protein BO70DRAFT_416497 [Aspergillus heteromorphus CBS 117.55]|uniref:Extracellular protein n=1 Tax=Aspergillus heteromorphus CBS 117.55 TaxID=1448321 RepID=A0A317V9P2_9EURO|nr:uncharacterized protein BO70DRAFT_416497 [Aspergillus heteromorphus CBS 117.55]PWY69748.1 hypothetical protein BO70DRAFT_416497 [Aspergillus heteromorphus CBS 117.55]